MPRQHYMFCITSEQSIIELAISMGTWLWQLRQELCYFISTVVRQKGESLLFASTDIKGWGISSAIISLTQARYG